MAEAERGQLDGQMKDVMAEDQVFVKKLVRFLALPL